MLNLDWLRQALRQFRQAPMYAFAVVASLALAIAATTASFAVVKRAFLDPMPFSNADRVVTIQTQLDGRLQSVSIFIAEDLRESPAFSGVAPLRFSTVTYEAPDASERFAAQEVTREFFSVLGVGPALGSVWPEGGGDTAIISWPVYQRVFSGDPAIIGRQIALDGRLRTIAGVMPESFVPPFGPTTGIWMPLDMRAALADTARGRRTSLVLALIAEGRTLEDVRAFMPVFSQGQRTRFPQVHGREAWVATPLREDMIGPSRTVLQGTGGAALLLMLIVWANIAGLSAAQAVAHRRANAVRAALGATTMRLFRERLCDMLVLTGFGTVAGLWLSDSLITIAAGYQVQFLPNMRPVAFDFSTVVLGLGLGALTALLAAGVPHQSVRQITSGDVLTGRGTAGGVRMTRIRSGLVVVQVAIAIVLLISGGLLIRTVRNLAATQMGFETEYLTTFTMMLPSSRYQNTAKHVEFERQVLERISGIPGVRGATASVGFPGAGAMGARLTILNKPDPGISPEHTYLSVAPNFFSFLGIPLKAGRDIAETDDFEAPRVVVINETMARMFWPAGDALGAKVKIGAGAPTDREITVVGIVPDVRQNGPTQEVRPTSYGSTLQYSWPRRHISVRTTRPVSDMAADLRAAVRAVDPLMAMPTIRAFDEQVAEQSARHRLVMIILGVFGVIATVLCGLGLYVVVALTAQFRRREFAIRLALGAEPGEVLWLVFRQSVILATMGAAAGVLGAAGATKTLQGLLYGVDPTDGSTFAAAVGTVLTLAICASLVPALRAGRIDPAETLKSE